MDRAVREQLWVFSLHRESALVSWERGLMGLCGVGVSSSLGQKCELQGSVAGRARLLKGLQNSYWCVC